MENTSEKEFIEFVQKLISIAKEKQEDTPENITVDKAIRAYYYITHCTFNQIGDILLFCASSSCLNRYVKQEDSLLKKEYRFKKAIYRLIQNLPTNNVVNGLKLMFDRDNGNTILYTSIFGMHYSYHSIEKRIESLLPKEYVDVFEWDGIKKQKCANTLFTLVEENNLCFSNQSFKGGNLKEEAHKLSDSYIDGSRTFDEIKKEFKLPGYCFSNNKELKPKKFSVDMYKIIK